MADPGVNSERWDELISIVASAADASSCPTLVGITGPVAVGKTTLAAEVAARLSRLGHRVATVSADGFLRPNTELAAAGLTMRKGFPETFDLEALRHVFDVLHESGVAEVPVYSHDTYDRVPDQVVRIEPADIVIIEGVIVLHDAVVDALDVRIYIDAEEEDIIGWFTDRFVDLCADAEESDGESFYKIFAGRSTAERRDMARATWAAINGVNLRDHIAPSRANADIVVVKGPHHEIRSVERPDPAS